MAFTQAYRKLVEEKLFAVTMIQTKAMFGGVGIYSEGFFFALIAEDKLFLKVDDSNRADFEARGMRPFFPYDSPKPMNYWELPEGVIDDPKELGVWIDRAVTVAKNSKKRRIRNP